MRLESALFSSSEGLNAHGQAISVVGDNIANSNTVGYKASRVEFGELLSEGSEGRNSTAGDNVGNGVKVEQVRQIHDVGAVEFTGKPLDVAIAGQGFFVVGDPAAPEFARGGNFSIDSDGLLATASGKPVLGFDGEGNQLGVIDMVDLELGGEATVEGAISGNLNSQSPITDEVPNNPASFNELNDQSSFVSTVQVFDSLGVSHTLTVAFSKTEANTWTAQGYVDGATVGQDAGIPVQVTDNLELNFEGDGSLPENAEALLIADIAFEGGANPGQMSIDLSGFSQFAGGSVLNSYQQDGQGAGAIENYEIRSDGSIFALLGGGSQALIGRLPLAHFDNPEGLDRTGSGLFVQTEASGEAIVDIAGTGARGILEGGALESSTVDQAKEFVDLVLYQRGYQASSRIFSAAGDMLRDTIQLVR